METPKVEDEEEAGRNPDYGELGGGWRVRSGQIMPLPKMHAGPGVLQPQMVTQVALGLDHGVLLSLGGVAFTWGDNRYGQLGRLSCSAQECVDPYQVDRLLGEEVLQVASGNHHCLALVAPGFVWAWGRNKVGQLGTGHTHDCTIPQRVCRDTGADDEGNAEDEVNPLGMEPGTRIIQIGAGCSNSVAASANSLVWQWGLISDKFGAVAELPAPPLKTRPFCVFSEEKFLTNLQKRRGAVGPSVSQFGCAVLSADDVMENVRSFVAAFLEVKEGTTLAKVAATCHSQKCKLEDWRKQPTEADFKSLRDMHMFMATAENFIRTIGEEIPRLENEIHHMKAQREDVRMRLDEARKEQAKLGQEDDRIQLRKVETSKRSTEWKRLQESLAEIQRKLESNVRLTEGLEDQKFQLETEHHKLTKDLNFKSKYLTATEGQLKTLKRIDSAMDDFSAVSTAPYRFLQQKESELKQTFLTKIPANDFVAAMKEVRAGDDFLRRVRESLQEMPGLKSSDFQLVARAQLIQDLLDDNIRLQETWSSLMKDKWLKDDLDLSCFFTASKKASGPREHGTIS